jgi:sugar lactone lactonase YvrE
MQTFYEADRSTFAIPKGDGVSATLTYEPVIGWEQLPEGRKHLDVSAVAVDGQDRVYLLTRFDQGVLVYDRDGAFLGSWGEDAFDRPHGMAASETEVWVTDTGDHTVRKFASDGELLIELGTPGVPSETGYDTSIPVRDQKARTETITGGPPFNQPTGVVVAADGDIFITDGYGNCRVHRYSPSGELLATFGTPGSGPGEFRLPHTAVFDLSGRLLVADRGNELIHVFTPEGELLESWEAQRPNSLAVSSDGLVFIGQSAWKVGNYSWRQGPITEDMPASVSVCSPEHGAVVATIGGGDASEPGNFVTCHGIALDSQDDLYVADVTYSSQSRDEVPDGRSFQKLQRS